MKHLLRILGFLKGSANISTVCTLTKNTRPVEATSVTRAVESIDHRDHDTAASWKEGVAPLLSKKLKHVRGAYSLRFSIRSLENRSQSLFAPTSP